MFQKTDAVETHGSHTGFRRPQLCGYFPESRDDEFGVNIDRQIILGQNIFRLAK
jgi:hypothetical protein